MLKKYALLLVIMSSIHLLLFTLATTPAPVAAGSNQPRFVNDEAGTMPLAAGEIVRVLCFANDTPGTLPNHDLLTKTDADGYATIALPADCQYAAALHLRHEQPSGKANHGPAYWIYNTSWQPGSVVPVSTAGDIFINQEWELVLFNLVASLAWQPAPNSTYLPRLHFGLEQASAYLHDISNGQMAFGPVTIHIGGENWDSADMQFLAANDYRPAAYIGGIVDQPIQHTSITGMEHTFTPAHILLGRGWDRFGDAADPTNNWATQDAYRTLIHEWSHYALFLFDEYQGQNGQLTDCTDSNNQNPDNDNINASIMDWHYSSSELWHPAHLTLPVDGCEDTWQFAAHGLSDWGTLGNWDSIQGLDPALALTIPGGPTDDGSGIGLTSFLFNRTPGHALYLPQIMSDGDPPIGAIEPTITVELTAAVAITDVIVSDVYVLRDDPFLMRQGRVYGNSDTAQFPGDISLLGILPDDTLQVFVEQYETEDMGDFPSGRYVYPAPNQIVPPISDGQTVTAVAQDWQMSLDASYGFTGSLLNIMRVQLASLNYAAELAANPPVLQLCVPDTAVGCPIEWRVEMIPSGGNWHAVFQPLPGEDELPLYSLLHVAAPGVGQLTRWVQANGGVGPGHIHGHAPMADGAVMVNTTTFIQGDPGCNQVVIMPAADYKALTTSLGYITTAPPALIYEGVVGTAYDIDIVLPGPSGSCPTTPIPGDQTLPVPVVVTLAYSQNDIDRLPISNETLQLRMLQYDRVLQSWQPIPVIDVDPDLNLVTGSISKGGVTVLAWARVSGPNP